MLKIIDYCLSLKNSYRVRAENALAAAIMCYEFGGADVAKKYIAQAIEFSVSVKGDAERLIPQN